MNFVYSCSAQDLQAKVQSAPQPQQMLAFPMFNTYNSRLTTFDMRETAAATVAPLKKPRKPRAQPPGQPAAKRPRLKLTDQQRADKKLRRAAKKATKMAAATQ